jgi:hypothetical protein
MTKASKPTPKQNHPDQLDLIDYIKEKEAREEAGSRVQPKRQKINLLVSALTPPKENKMLKAENTNQIVENYKRRVEHYKRIPSVDRAVGQQAAERYLARKRADHMGDLLKSTPFLVLARSTALACAIVIVAWAFLYAMLSL